MSYVSMDHAGWVERQIAAYKKSPPRAQERKLAAEHRGWYAAPDVLNDFQRRAINILGIVGGGIYNAPISWRGMYWSPTHIGVAWYGGLGTYDFDGLTRLVMLCHEARIRGHVSPHGFQHLYVTLHERQAAGCMSIRHPNVEEMLARWRGEFPVDHSIVYRVAPAAAVEASA